MHKSEIAFVIDNLPEPPNKETEISEFDSKQEIEGNFGAKIDSITRLILDLIQQEKSVKILVFSEWQEVLDIVSVALKLNKIPHDSRKSLGKRIQSFKTQDFNVLLLPVKNGGNGLNLIEATHVIFVEPLLNPGLDAQAVNRVHRIGQTKNTHVYRFCINNTIETKILSWTKDSARIMSHKQNKKEIILTSEDVKFLIGNNSDWLVQQPPMESSQPADLTNSQEKPLVTARPNIPQQDPEEFWNSPVLWHGIKLSRKEVVPKLQVQQSWILKEQGQNIHETPHEEFFNRYLPSIVIDHLLSLSHPLQNTTTTSSTTTTQQEEIKDSKMEI